MGDDFLSAGNPDLKMKSIKYDEFHRRKDSEDVTADANFHGQITFQGENIEWDMYRRSTSGSSLNPSRYKPAYQHLMQLYRKYDELPLLAYFQILSRIHSQIYPPLPSNRWLQMEKHYATLVITNGIMKQRV